MFTLDQTVDPFRDFFMPFSFPKQRESLRNPGAATVMLRLDTGPAAHSNRISSFASIPKPLLALMVHLTANALVFSLIAGLTLLVFYLFKELSIPAPPIKFLFQGILVADLLLLLLSVAKIVFRTLRDI